MRTELSEAERPRVREYEAERLRAKRLRSYDQAERLRKLAAETLRS